ncbi:MAG TPA: VRR-NUC domain-containing protein [Castellaniella sp.]|uniref:VRR-NUC domain-containing protein n=1 Tax=Castellaniella sp. TaxID=1955812 RepID=UPI002F020059
MNHIEDDHQAALIRWARLQSKTTPELALLLHIPNGGRRNIREAARLKAQGVRAGVPDLLLPVSRFGRHGLWIELKAPKNGRVSADQKQWIEDLNKQGYAAMVCVGWLQARDAIIDYLGGL